MSTDIDVGRLIAGKYELVRLLGKGAMGEVWLATHNSLGGEFAVKLVTPSEDVEDESAAGRFQLEAQVSAKLSRKTRHIVSVSDHGEENGLAYLVMELLEGESLEARLRRSKAMPLAEVVAIVSQVARALSMAHAEGIFHRDLKPANLYLTRDEDGRLLVKLLDFGIARMGEGAKPIRTRSPFATGKDMVLGTPSYMSPEQARGLGTLDYRCDVWALGVVAYEALVGKIPWEGDSVEDIFLSICTHRVIPIHSRNPELPPAIEAIFSRAFASKLADRFVQATELSLALEDLITPEELDAAIGSKKPAGSVRRLANSSIQQTGAGQNQLQRPPSSDLLAVSLGETSAIHIPKRSVGWVYAATGGVALVALAILILISFNSKSGATADAAKANAGNATATTASAAPVIPPPPDPAPKASAAPIVTAPAPTTAPRPGAPVKPAAAVVTTVAPQPATPAPPPPPVTAVAPPPPRPPATATAKKPADRGEIF